MRTIVVVPREGLLILSLFSSDFILYVIIFNISRFLLLLFSQVPPYVFFFYILIMVSKERF